MGFQVSKNFHSHMTKSVIESPIAFFDTNQAGSILTRFAQDAHTIDSTFFLTMYKISVQMQRLFAQFLTCIIAFHYSLPVFVLLLILSLLVVRCFNETIVCIRDHASKNRAEINSFFVLLNEGLPSIRATGRQGYFR